MKVVVGFSRNLKKIAFYFYLKEVYLESVYLFKV